MVCDTKTSEQSGRSRKKILNLKKILVVLGVLVHQWKPLHAIANTCFYCMEYIYVSVFVCISDI